MRGGQMGGQIEIVLKINTKHLKNNSIQFLFSSEYSTTKPIFLSQKSTVYLQYKV